MRQPNDSQVDYVVRQCLHWPDGTRKKLSKSSVDPERINHTRLLVQALLDKYAVVFSPPTGLPPRRQFDHSIPLIPGAQLVSIRPYRIPPHLKVEMEKQVQAMLQGGLI